MAVKMMSLTKYVFISAADTGDKQTEFDMKPLDIDVYMPVFSAFQLMQPAGNTTGAQSKELAATILGPDGKRAMCVIRDFLKDHIIEVRNFQDENGELKSGPGADYWNRVNMFLAVEIVADAIMRSTTPPETAKNSK